MEIRYWNRTNEWGTTHKHTQTMSWCETSKPPTGIAALLQQFWLVQPSHWTWSHAKKNSFPAIHIVQSMCLIHSSFTSYISRFPPVLPFSVSILTFRVVKNAPPLQLSYVPILPSPSVAQPHTAFDVPVRWGRIETTKTSSNEFWDDMVWQVWLYGSHLWGVFFARLHLSIHITTILLGLESGLIHVDSSLIMSFWFWITNPKKSGVNSMWTHPETFQWRVITCKAPASWYVFSDHSLGSSDCPVRSQDNGWIKRAIEALDIHHVQHSISL